VLRTRVPRADDARVRVLQALRPAYLSEREGVGEGEGYTDAWRMQEPIKPKIIIVRVRRRLMTFLRSRDESESKPY